MAEKKPSWRSRVGRVTLLVMTGILLVFPMLLLSHPIAYIPFISAVLLVLVSCVYLQVVKRAVSVNADEMLSAVERGCASSLTVTLSNKAPVPCARLRMSFFVTDIFGEYDDIKAVDCSIKAHEVMHMDFDVEFPHLGTYYAGISYVEVFDLLGLFSVKMKDGVRRQVVVRPKRVKMNDIRSLKAVPDESVRALKPVSADDVDYASVREYRYGDPLKTIHWNLSARTPGHTMYTRLYEAYVNPTLSIVLDAYSQETDPETLMSLFDGMVEVSVAVSELARASGIEAEVHYLGKDGDPKVSRLASISDADDMVLEMKRIEHGLDTSGTTEEMLRKSGLHVRGSGNIALVTSRINSDEMAVLSEILARQRNAMAFLAVSRDMSERKRASVTASMQKFSSAGGAWWTVESNAVMTEVVGL